MQSNLPEKPELITLPKESVVTLVEQNIVLLESIITLNNHYVKNFKISENSNIALEKMKGLKIYVENLQTNNTNPNSLNERFNIKFQ